jgi:hypothetical protein
MGMKDEEPDDWLLLEEMEEEEATRKPASVKEDRDPHIELQEPGVSHLAMLKENESLTIPPSSPPPLYKAAWTQRSPAVNTRTPAIPEPASGAHLVPPLPHDPPPPDEAAEPPDKSLPEQIQGPIIEGEPLESPQGKALQHTTWHTGQPQVQTPEGKEPLGMAHGHPPDLPDLYS